MTTRRTKPLQQLVFDNIVVDPDRGCWLKKPTTGNRGYAKMKTIKNGKPVSERGHRFSWRAFNGEIPEGLDVLHRCDVRNCMNPSHLFLGTNLDNINDKIAKNRQPKGEEIRSAKLTEEAVRFIRKSDKTIRELAKQFNVDKSTIRQVKLKITWKWVSE